VLEEGFEINDTEKISACSEGIGVLGQASHRHIAAIAAAVPSRRLEDRILRLCGQVVAVDADSSEFYALASELRSNLSEHIRRTRAVLAEYPASGQRRRQAEEGSDKRVRE